MRRRSQLGSPQGGIVVVGPAPPPIHGVAVMTVTIVDELRRLGVSVRHVDTADRRGLANIGRFDIGNVALGLQHGVEIWDAVRRSRPAATILPISQSSLSLLRDLMWAIGPLFNESRLILHLHGAALADFYRTAPPPIRAALRWLGRRTWRAVVLTSGARRQFNGLVGTDRVRVLPNAVPDTLPASLQSRSGRFRVLYLSNLARAKGYLDLLRAAVRLAPEIPSLELVLAGDWYDGRREAEGLLVSEELAGRVHLPGVVTGETKQALLATANVFAFPPSQLEGQPLVLLEAMAAGLPIVTTNSGLIPETVSEGENAILVPSNNPEALAAALRTLWSDPALCARMGRASRALYLERYTLDRFRRNLAALVGELGLPF